MKLKEIILGGLLAIFVVICSTSIMIIFSAGALEQGGTFPGYIIFFILVIFTAIGIFITETLNKERKIFEESLSSRLKLRTKTQLFGAAGLAGGGLLGLAVRFPLQNIAITNIFWLWIGLLPLSYALTYAQTNLIEKKLPFAISYIIFFVVSILIVSNFFNSFVRLLIFLNG